MSRFSTSSSSDRWQFAPEDFPKGQNEPFERIFRLYYTQYQNWARGRWGETELDLTEAFTDAVMIFRKKVWDGKMEDYRGKAVNTILFSFAANLVRNQFKQQQKHRDRYTPLSDQPEGLEVASASLVEDELEGPLFQQVAEGKLARLQAAMAELSDRCRTLLQLRIVHGLSMPDIADHLGLANANTAKTAKNKCLKRLKSLLGL